MKRNSKNLKPASQQGDFLQERIGTLISLAVAMASLGSLGLFV